MDMTVQKYANDLKSFISFLEIEISDKEALLKGVNAMVMAHERIIRQQSETAPDTSINDNLTINEKP